MTFSESTARNFMMSCFFTAALLVGTYGFQRTSQGDSQRAGDRSQSTFSLAPEEPQAVQSTSATLQAALQVEPADSTSFGGTATPPIAAPQSSPVATQPAPPSQTAVQPQSLLTQNLFQPHLQRSPQPFSTATAVSMRPVLQVLTSPHLVIDLSDRQVGVYRGNLRKATYDVAIGKAGWETPVGEFRVIDKQVNPYWQHPITKRDVPPGPDNPLGSRWIAFWTDGVHYIGFHGTQREDLIGQAVSHGCVRMRNEEIEALYEQVVIGTPVVVQP